MSLTQLALFFKKGLGKPLYIYLKLKDFKMTSSYIIRQVFISFFNCISKLK
ncbi:hypothetical protein HMPREF1864_00730 [Peptoniphilus sp. DNF00840]|nr:hypothetical protein HMPREF1864_00730 [Peptoniphilus sp. DNF00840]